MNLNILLQWIFTHKTIYATISFKESRNLSSEMPDRPDTEVDTNDPLCADTVSATTTSALSESQHPTPVDFYP